MAAGRQRTILVTGVTRGIGRALAERFLAAGHVVHGCGRDERALGELSARHGGPSSFERLDVADDGAVQAWARRLHECGQVPDLVLNNAAVINEPAPLWEVTADEFARVLAVNVGGVANVVRAFVPAMIAAGRGVIVNLSSGWGRSTSPDVGPYCTTKWAIEGFSGSLSQELPAGLACVALSPGVVDTDMLRRCLPDTARASDDPDTWARRNADFVLQLGRRHNGRSLSVT